MQPGTVRYGDRSAHYEGVHTKYRVMEMLLYGCVTLALGMEHFTVLHSAHRKLLLRIIGLHRRQRADDRMSCAKALKKAPCESVETTISKWRLLAQRVYSGQILSDNTRWVLFGTMFGGENPGPGRPEENMSSMPGGRNRVV